MDSIEQYGKRKRLDLMEQINGMSFDEIVAATNDIEITKRFNINDSVTTWDAQGNEITVTYSARSVKTSDGEYRMEVKRHTTIKR